ncbi:MAG: tyrosine-type recombinase/integrase [Candidatus Melainabacteria bacterium]|jgi:site-specific recombinase XerD
MPTIETRKLFASALNHSNELVNQSIKDLIRAFLNQIEAFSSLNTLKAYRSDLNALKNFESIVQINDSVLRDLRLELISKYSEKTAARRWSALREFFRFCQLSGYIKENPILNIENANANNQKIIQSRLSHETATQICDQPEKLRDKALLWFLYSTGARPSEIIQFGIFKNLNLASGEFYVNGRTTFLCDKALNFLKEYIGFRRVTPALYERIFVNDKEEPLSEIFVYTLFAKTAESLSLTASARDIRETLMIRLYQQGLSVEELKYLFGFKSIQSIEPILHTVEKVAPGSNIKETR